MELIDTPNPNAKKVIVNHDYEIAINIEKGNKGGDRRLQQVELPLS